MVEREQEAPSLVVGIGASAGGLEALGKFFSTLKEDLGIALVIVQHLSPKYPSMMAEILTRHTHLPIRVVENQLELRANTVYLAPPGYLMSVKPGLLSTRLRPSEHPHDPINHLFETLAQSYQERAVAIVLSGSGSDGSQGLLHIHQRGGLVLAEGESASFRSMPRSAVETGKTHASLAPEDMPALLESYNDTRSIEEALMSSEVEALGGGDAQTRILKLLQREHKIDFSVYKQKTTLRRILRRASLCGDASLETYLERLSQHPEELAALRADLLIGVTQFFRDPEHWQILRNEVLEPGLRQAQARGEEFRAWVVGCSTGEEAYSLAYLLRSLIQELGLEISARVFATDVHESALREATAGAYTAEQVGTLPEDTLSQMFTQLGEQYIIQEELRGMVLFSVHNLLEDPPFGRLDLTTCRNLLIYFNAEAQRRALGALHFSLKLRGHLFLGPSESLGELGSEYERVGARSFNLFQKQGNRRVVMLHPFRSPNKPTQVLKPLAQAREALHTDILAVLAGDAVLVNDAGQVRHLFGEVSSLLHPPPGPLNTSLAAMCPGSLGVLVNAALKEARSLGARATQKAQLQQQEQWHSYLIHVDPIPSRDQAARNYLVRFERQEDPPEGAPTLLGDSAQARIQELERDLQDAHLSLQTVVEELEMTNEELQSTNEELHANLEELQATNEELHSVNEELFSVNSEYELKLRQLSKARKDQENLLQSIDAGIIFVNNDRTLRFFSPLAATFYNLQERDIGRDLTHITARLETDIGAVHRALALVLERGQPQELHLTLENQTHWSVKLKPYLNAQQLPEGAVITLSETTELDKLRRAAADQRDRLTQVLDHVPQGIWEADDQGKTTYTNRFISDFSGVDKQHPLEKGWDDLIHPADLQSARQSWRQHLEKQTPFQTSFRLKHHSGDYRWVNSSAIPMINGQGQVEHWYGSITDVHKLFVTKQKLRRFNEELEELVKERTLEAQLSEQRLMLAGEHGTDGFWDWNLLTNEEYLSPRFKELFGYQDHEMENKPQSWMDIIFPEDLVRAQEALRGHLEEGKPYNLDVRYRHKDGSTVWVICRGAAQRDAQGRWARMVGTHTDITALKRAQEQLSRTQSRGRTLATFKRVVDKAPIKLWLADERGQRTYFSESWLQYTGRSLEQERGQSWLQRVHPEDRARLKAQLADALEHGVSYTARYRLMCSDGTYGEVFERAVPYHDEDETLQGYVGSTFDAQDTQTPYAQKLSLLAGGIAHDFNNILTGILLPAGMGKLETPPHTPTASYFEAIEQSAQRASELCRLLMDASGASSIKTESLDLEALARNTVAQLPATRQPTVTLIWDFPPRLPKVQAAPTQLQRVVMNLVLNAVDALEGQPGTLSLRAELRSSFQRPPTHLPVNDHLVDGRYVVLEVQDTGKGISQTDLQRIFDPFFTTKVMGRGLGLASARGALKAASGAIEVESTLGEGTSFRLWLPLAMAPEEAAPSRPDQPPPGLLGDPSTHILVVDDESAMLVFLRQHLARAGFEVHTYERGSAALADGWEEPPRLALIDYTMPEMKGEELARLLRRRFPKIQIVLMSGYSVEHLDTQLDLELFDAFLQKPFELSQLNQVLQGLLG